MSSNTASNTEVVTGMFERLDFQTPRRPDESSSRTLSRWHAEICSLVQERWETLLPDQIKITPASILPSVERAALLALPLDGIGAHVELGAERISSLIVSSGRLSRALVESVLNIQGEDWPEAGRLSPGEFAILEILYENVCDAIRESWPGSEPILCRFLESIANPNRTRLFSKETDLLVMKFQIETQYGTDELTWLVPKQKLEDLISKEFEPTLHRVTQSSNAMTELAEKIPIEIIVELGSAEITMSEATQLSMGDVLLLDQSIRKPLIARVTGQEKWKVNPVTVGKRVGFQVIDLIEN